MDKFESNVSKDVKIIDISDEESDNNDNNYDSNEDSVNNKKAKKRRINKEVLVLKIIRQEVIEEIDKNHELVKVFRGKHKSNDNSLAKVIYGFGCNWNECHYIECKKDRVLAHIMSKHTFEKPFRCNECNYKTHCKYSLTNHMKNIHSKQQTSCYVNSTNVNTENQLMVNTMDNSIDVKPILDLNVNNIYFNELSNESNNDLHNSMKNDLSEGLDNQKIDSLNENYLSKDHLMKMIDRKLVEKETDEMNKLITVFRIKNSKNEKSLKNKILRYGCNRNECQITYCTKDEVISHINTDHTSDEPLSCVKTAINTYSKNIDNKKIIYPKFKCDFNDCRMEFEKIYDLRVHEMQHKSIKPYACHWSQCQSCFDTEVELKDHILSDHSSDGQYLCEWPACGLRFKTDNGLRRHKLIHSKQRISSKDKHLSCDWPNCGAKFANNKLLETHRTVHKSSAKVKNFVCNWPQCGQQFDWYSKLKQHLLVHQNIRSIECLFKGCNQRFTSNAIMIRHYKTHK